MNESLTMPENKYKTGIDTIWSFAANATLTALGKEPSKDPDHPTVIAFDPSTLDVDPRATPIKAQLQPALANIAGWGLALTIGIGVIIAFILWKTVK